jgi:hypothetical protein
MLFFNFKIEIIKILIYIFLKTHIYPKFEQVVILIITQNHAPHGIFMSFATTEFFCDQVVINLIKKDNSRF